MGGNETMRWTSCFERAGASLASRSRQVGGGPVFRVWSASRKPTPGPVSSWWGPTGNRSNVSFPHPPASQIQVQFRPMGRPRGPVLGTAEPLRPPEAIPWTPPDAIPPPSPSSAGGFPRIVPPVSRPGATYPSARVTVTRSRTSVDRGVLRCAERSVQAPSSRRIGSPSCGTPGVPPTAGPSDQGRGDSARL
jgi:hypothetical protein